MVLIRKICRWILQFAAGFVILLALLVGVARLLLPEVSGFTGEIRAAVRSATGFDLGFREISAGVSFYGPELRLRGVDLSWPDGQSIILVERLVVSVNVIDSLRQQRVLPGRILVDGTSVNAQITEAGDLLLQGRDWRELLPPDADNEEQPLPDIRLELADTQFTFQNDQLGGPLIVGVASSLTASLDDGEVEFAAEIAPGEKLGSWLEVEATAPLALLLTPEEFPDTEDWAVSLYAEDFRLDPWLRLLDIRDLPVIGSSGDVRSELRFTGLQLTSIESDVDLEDIGLVQPSGTTATVDWLEGRLNWRLLKDGWSAQGEGLTLSRNGRVWPEGDFSLRYSVDSDLQRYRAEVAFLRFDDVLPFVLAVFPDLPTEAGLSGGIYGDLSNLKLDIGLRDGSLDNWLVETIFDELGYSAPTEGIELTGFSGEVKADTNGGDLRIFSRDARFGLLTQFREAFELSRLQGVAVWRSDAAGHRLIANSIELATPHGEALASAELQLDREFGNPVIDISGTASMNDVAQVPRYLPYILPEVVLDWLGDALQGGRVTDAEFLLRGPVKKFPFRNGEGEFRAVVNFVDAVLDYAPDWPPLRAANGQVVFDRFSFSTSRNRFQIADTELRNINLKIADMGKGVVEATGAAADDLNDVLTLLRASPVGDALGPVFADVQAEGPVEAELELFLPINDLDAWKFDAQFEVRDATAGLAGIDPQFENIVGSGSVANTFITIPAAEATLLGEPVSIRVMPGAAEQSPVSHTADVAGALPLQGIWEAFGMPATDLLGGASFIEAQALFPADTDNEATPFRVLLKSDLQGGISSFPYPLDKPADVAEPTTAELRFPEQGVINYTGSVRGINWMMKLLDDADGWFIERGLVGFGRSAAELPSEPGLQFLGYLDLLVLQDWYDAFSVEHFPDSGDSSEYDDWPQMFTLIDMQYGELHLFNHRFVDVDAAARPGVDSWIVRATGPWLEGDAQVPFSFTSGVPLTVDLERLLLIEPLEGEDDYSDQLDPREWPAMRGTINDFALGTMRFGKFELDIEPVADGLRSKLLRTTAGSFSTESSADWLVIDNAQRTRLHLELESTDFEKTLKDLDYSPMMTGKSGKVVADLLWEGMPDERMIYESTGKVRLKVENGIIRELEPGGGRLLGLASVTALPRRLSLDFSEITEDGLVFDKIAGTFRIDFGNAWTCDLGLEGDIADMGIVGRVGITAEDYDQVAAVRPHMSNLAPVAGAFLAGPAVGAATLLITQIFKKPLSGMGGSYFTITGSWDEPQVETAERDNLDLTQFSECEAELPVFSPEEVQAMQDLIDNKDVEPAAPLTPRSGIGPVPEE